MPRDVLLLLDRDGTLMDDVGYPNDPAAVRLIPGAANAVRELVGRGFVPAVVSNQSGLARGLISPELAVAVHARFVELFENESGVRLPCFYCPHGPADGCDCRKPQQGLLKQAAEALGMVGRPAVMVGDKPADVEAGKRFGAMTFFLRQSHVYPNQLPPPDFSASDWTEILWRLQASGGLT